MKLTKKMNRKSKLYIFSVINQCYQFLPLCHVVATTTYFHTHFVLDKTNRNLALLHKNSNFCFFYEQFCDDNTILA